MTDPAAWWQTLGTACALGALLGAVVSLLNSWRP